MCVKRVVRNHLQCQATQASTPSMSRRDDRCFSDRNESRGAKTVSDPSIPKSENVDNKKEVSVDGYGLVALGAYLVLFTLIVVVVIWQVIPSCDVVGFVVTRLTPSQALTTGGEQVRIAGEGFQRGVTVRVGDKTAATSVISPFDLATTTPQLPAGRVAVTVTQQGFPPMDVP